MEASTIKVEKLVGGRDVGEERKFGLNTLGFMCLLDKGMGISSRPSDESLYHQRGHGLQVQTWELSAYRRQEALVMDYHTGKLQKDRVWGCSDVYGSGKRGATSKGAASEAMTQGNLMSCNQRSIFI